MTKKIKSTRELKNIREILLKSDNKIYSIYAIYSNKKLSLCIHGYTDTEQDYLTHVSEIEVLE